MITFNFLRILRRRNKAENKVVSHVVWSWWSDCSRARAHLGDWEAGTVSRKSNFHRAPPPCCRTHCKHRWALQPTRWQWSAGPQWCRPSGTEGDQLAALHFNPSDISQMPPALIFWLKITPTKPGKLSSPFDVNSVASLNCQVSTACVCHCYSIILFFLPLLTYS